MQSAVGQCGIFAARLQDTRPGHSAAPHPAHGGGGRSHDSPTEECPANREIKRVLHGHIQHINAVVPGQAIQVGRDGTGKVGRNQINRLRSSNVHVLHTFGCCCHPLSTRATGINISPRAGSALVRQPC